MLKDKSGRRVLHWLIYEVAGLQDVTFNPKIKDGDCANLHHIFGEGRRWVGAQVYNALKSLSIGQVSKMIDEAARDAQEMQAALISGGNNE